MRQRLKRSPWPSGALWRHPDFLKLWAGQTVSEFGSQFSLLALPLVAIYSLHASASAAQLGGPGIAGAAIHLVTAPYASLADTISFVLSSGFVSAIRKAEPRREETAAEAPHGMKRELLEGLRYVLGNEHLRAI